MYSSDNDAFSIGRLLLIFLKKASLFQGGPSFTASHHLAANNFPLRGSKATDLEGGVRVGAFISGVSCHDIAGIWVAFFSRWQRYRC